MYYSLSKLLAVVDATLILNEKLTESLMLLQDHPNNQYNSLPDKIKIIRTALEHYATMRFTIGARVRMNKTREEPERNQDGSHNGWYEHRHTFVEGALATVKDIALHEDGRIILEVMFDNELYETEDYNAPRVNGLRPMKIVNEEGLLGKKHVWNLAGHWFDPISQGQFDTSKTVKIDPYEIPTLG